MDTAALDPFIGQLLDGRYRIEARIAVGGMGTVYRAVDTRLDRVLAVKVMHPSLAADDSFVERFIREAKSAARLAHPNVVQVFDQGTDGACVYLAMEYIAGCTLRELLRERGALQPRAALDVLEPVLAALGAAHRAGLVHRDMKPENVLIGDDGRVKVADFGLARTVDTHTGGTDSVLGTVSYLAPEQIEYGTADARADVYACGVTLYEMLTGGKPHAGGSPAQVLYQHLHEDVPAPSATVPGLASALDVLVARAAARDPRQRPGDAVELLAEARNVRSRLTGQQLDALPERSAPAAERRTGPEARTRVVPRPAAHSACPAGPGAPGDPVWSPAAGDDSPGRTSRLPLPVAASAGGGPPGRRPLAALIGAVLLVLGLGAGVWYINAGQFTRTPSVLDRTETEARRILGGAGLDVAVERAFSDTVASGRVVDSDPEPGGRVRETGTVTITVSRGPEVVRVPALDGRPLPEARRELGSVGLVPGEVRREVHADVPRGSVIRTDPAAGAERRPRSAVDLVVSEGLPTPVPNVVGAPEGTARQTLREAGFTVEVKGERVFSEEEAGTIAGQSVPGGTRVAEGQLITLTVSKGPELVQVPEVEGEDADRARRTLEAAGFEVRVRALPLLNSTVLNQSPDGGQQAPRGSTVTLWLR